VPRPRPRPGVQEPGTIIGHSRLANLQAVTEPKPYVYRAADQDREAEIAAHLAARWARPRCPECLHLLDSPLHRFKCGDRHA
jgi:hypothetical protein